MTYAYIGHELPLFNIDYELAHTEPKPQRPGRRKAAVQRSADRVARLAFSSLPVLGSDDPRVVGRPDDDRRISGVSRHDVSRTTNSVHTE